MTRIDAAPSLSGSPPPLPVEAIEADKTPPPLPPSRMGSVDAYRGLVMFLMMAEVLRLCAVAAKVKDSDKWVKDLWAFLCYHQTHAEWISDWSGCSLHDLIQPSFSFLVGVALPFSMASRLARGQSKAWLTAHAFWRALLLIALGVFLRSLGRDQTNFTFEDTLCQIGLGYPFLFLLGFFSARAQWIALAVILLGDWAAFALYPTPGTDFDYAAVHVPASWPHLTGLAAHWDKNANLAWAFDTWFLNLFPRARPFTANSGGYATLSFVPTLGTMILGLLAGGVLRRPSSGWAKVLSFVVAGAIMMAAGWGLGVLGVCPVVKRIWTPSWVLYSGGWCFLFLAGFYAVIDLLGIRFWAFPLRVIGMNSIAAYCMAGLFEGFFHTNLRTHLGDKPFRVLGGPYEPLLHGAAVLLILWLILFWMYRRKIFLRI
jgi:heparan-alpha-glucosaminide N-acetyltransferase